jgi:hypothetical protein
VRTSATSLHRAPTSGAIKARPQYPTTAHADTGTAPTTSPRATPIANGA